MRSTLQRWILTAIVILWATISGFNEMRRTDTRVAWDLLAGSMSQIETSKTEPVKVYALDDFPRYPMNFYLKAASDERFEFVRIDTAGLAAPLEAPFWVVYEEGSWKQSPLPAEVLRSRGFAVSPAYTSGPHGRRYILFRVSLKPAP